MPVAMPDYWSSKSAFGCTKDPDHPGVEIHRFVMGSRVCMCGKYRINPPVLKQAAWRQFGRKKEKRPESQSAFEPDLLESLEPLDELDGIV